MLHLIISGATHKHSDGWVSKGRKSQNSNFSGETKNEPMKKAYVHKNEYNEFVSKMQNIPELPFLYKNQWQLDPF